MGEGEEAKVDQDDTEAGEGVGWGAPAATGSHRAPES